MNNTDSALPHTIQHEQASGTSTFWALLSLALSAMTQPSFYGYVFSSKTFSTSISPHRSSPFVCLADAGVDLWTIRRHMRDKAQQPCTADGGTCRTPARPTAVAIAQLALLGLGVLPPALKLFDTSGIPRSQLLGAVFLASTLTGAARTLLVGNPSEEDLVDIADVLRTPRSDGRHFASATEDDLFLPTVFPRSVCLLLTWSRIGKQINLGVPQQISYAFGWAGLYVGWILCAYAAQHTFFIVIRGQWHMPRFPMLAMTGAVYLFLFYCELLLAPADRPVDYSAFGPLTMVLLGHAALFSLALSSLLRTSIKRLLEKFTRLPDTGIDSTPEYEARHSLAVEMGVNRYLYSNDTSPPPPAARDLGLADSGDIGLAALPSQHLQHIIPDPIAQNSVSAGKTPPASKKPPRRHHIKTEAEAKRDFPRASRAIHATFNPETEDPTEWEQLLMGNRGPYTGPAPPPAALWRRLCFNVLFYIVVIVYRLGLTVYSTFHYFKGWLIFYAEPWQGETGWLGSAILNALTVAAYYFTAFEAEGTAAPGWTQALG